MPSLLPFLSSCAAATAVARLGGDMQTDINAAKKSFGGAMQTFDNTRPMVAGMAIGLGQAALDMTIAILAVEGYEDNFCDI